MTRYLLWLIILVLSLAVTLVQAGTKHYYYTDAQGTVLAKADARGSIIATYDYAPYGTQVLGTPPSGPVGYTGHVNDAESGFVYMQARYMDPQSGRFLGVDPMRPVPGDIFTFNRYAYADDNPLKFIDPDGRRVKATFDNMSAFTDAIEMAVYLSQSRTALQEFGRILMSNQNYSMEFSQKGKDGFNVRTKTILVNTRSGLIVDSSKKILSPAVMAGHEISHAAEYDRIGLNAYRESAWLKGEVHITYPITAPPEEERATKVEGDIAREVGESGHRSNYYDYPDNDAAGEITTCSSTSAVSC